MDAELHNCVPASLQHLRDLVFFVSLLHLRGIVVLCSPL